MILFHKAVFLLLALLPTALPAQRYASVTFRNGELLIDRKVDSLGTATVVLMVGSADTPRRGVLVQWFPLVATGIGLVAGATGAMVQAGLPVGDSYEFEHTVGSVAISCETRWGCWATFRNVGRAGYWKPLPDLTGAQVQRLGQALREAANGASVTTYTLDLRGSP